VVNPEQHDDAVVARLRELLGAQLVYRFGSTVTGATHPGSDVDYAFLPTGSVDPVVVFDLSGELATRMNVEVDLVDLAAASTVMRKEVVRTGRCLFAASERVYREFEMYTLSDYARLNEERARAFKSM